MQVDLLEISDDKLHIYRCDSGFVKVYYRGNYVGMMGRFIDHLSMEASMSDCFIDVLTEYSVVKIIILLKTSHKHRTMMKQKLCDKIIAMCENDFNPGAIYMMSDIINDYDLGMAFKTII